MARLLLSWRWWPPGVGLAEALKRPAAAAACALQSQAHAQFQSLRRFGSKKEDEIDERLLPWVSIIGRPNVGKSALFNALCGGRLALVHNTPGSHVTRDYKEGVGRISDLTFKVVDTSGLEPSFAKGSIQARATALTAKVLGKSHLVLLVLDGREGLSITDFELSKWLRGHVDPQHVIPVINKAESRAAQERMDDTVAETLRLGYGEPVALSATTLEGITDLYVALQPRIDDISAQLRETYGDPVAAAGYGLEGEYDDDDDDGTDDAEEDGEQEEGEEVTYEGGGPGSLLKMAIMGLPNVGKSTLLNQILKEERSITGPEPGLTRDAVTARWQAPDGQQLQITDTAGWMRSARLHDFDDVGGDVALKTLRDGYRSLNMVHVVVIMVDASLAVREDRVLSTKEMTLAGIAIEEGKAVVMAPSKMDLLSEEQKQVYVKSLQKVLSARYVDAGVLPVVPVSGLTGQGVQQLQAVVADVYSRWNKRVGTGPLNRFLEQLRFAYLDKGDISRMLDRIKYLTQVKARPPTFVLFINGQSQPPEAFTRFLATRLRSALDFQGVPLRLYYRFREPQSARERAAASFRKRLSRDEQLDELVSRGTVELVKHARVGAMEREGDDADVFEPAAVTAAAAGPRRRSYPGKGAAAVRRATGTAAADDAAEFDREVLDAGAAASSGRPGHADGGADDDRGALPPLARRPSTRPGAAFDPAQIIKLPSALPGPKKKSRSPLYTGKRGRAKSYS